MSDWYDAARAHIKSKVTSSDNSFGGLMSAWFKAGAPGSGSGGAVVTPQTKPADLTAAPTQQNFNDLTALLKTAGVFK